MINTNSKFHYTWIILTDKVGAKNEAILAMSLGIIYFVLLMAFRDRLFANGKWLSRL